MIWDGTIPADPNQREKCLVAFEARVPGSGGYVVTSDGIVRVISAHDFAGFRELPGTESPVVQAAE